MNEIDAFELSLHRVAAAARVAGKNGRGRGSKRRQFDFYPTPRWQTDHLLGRIDLHACECFNGYEPFERAWQLWPNPLGHMFWCADGRPPRILEPCVGEGHITNAIRARYPNAVILTNDIDPRHRADTTEDATQQSFWENNALGYGRLDWVITNPPFSDAFAILRQAFEAATIGVAFLLRVTWLEPPKSAENQNKARWLAEHPPTAQFILERTSYDGAGQDSATSAWFVWLKAWQPGDPQRIEIIPGRARKEPLL